MKNEKPQVPEKDEGGSFSSFPILSPCLRVGLHYSKQHCEPKDQIATMKISQKEKQESGNGSCPGEKVKTAPTLLLCLYPEKGATQNSQEGNDRVLHFIGKQSTSHRLHKKTISTYLNPKMFCLQTCAAYIILGKQKNDATLFITQKEAVKKINPWLIGIP